MFVIFPPAILGPEMAPPILWAHGIFCLFLQDLHARKIPRFRGGDLFFLGGGEVQFFSNARGCFLSYGTPYT